MPAVVRCVGVVRYNVLHHLWLFIYFFTFPKAFLNPKAKNLYILPKTSYTLGIVKMPVALPR